MPLARLSGADIQYEIIGDEGPWVALVSGGRNPLPDLAGLGWDIARHGYRVLLHDRRGCGHSSLDFDNLEPEEDVWADDLAELLDRLDATPAIIGGRSRGGRVALRFALRHGATARALLLWGISGGPLAIRFLDEFYFGEAVRAARAGGMPAVCATKQFKELVEYDASKREQLLAFDPATFIAVTEHRRVQFFRSATGPVMGFTDDELRAIRAPTLIVPYYDRAHPDESLRHAEQTIPVSHLVDFAPERRMSQARHAATPERDIADQIVIAEILDRFVRDLDVSDRTEQDRPRRRRLWSRPSP